MTPATTPEPAESPAHDRAKTVATLSAKAALARIAVHELASGGFIACIAGWPVRELPDLAALAGFLRQQGIEA